LHSCKTQRGKPHDDLPPRAARFHRDTLPHVPAAHRGGTFHNGGTMNRYVNQFLGLRCAPDVLGTVGALGNKAAKEITESMAVIRRMRGITLAAPMEYGLIDLCAGNALTSVLAVHMLPVKWASAVDKRERNRRWHKARRFQYHVDDIYDNMVINHVCAKYKDPIVIIAVHACGQLAERVIELYQNTPEARHLVLMPCCEGGGKNRVPRCIRKRIGPYLAWCWHLNELAGGRLLVDQQVHSPKNGIILASK